MTGEQKAREALVEKVARGLCTEKCAFRGEPPCHAIDGPWPPETCCEPGCMAEARAVIALVVDECARVAETCFGPKDEALTVGEAGGYDLAMDRIATAIRALGGVDG